MAASPLRLAVRQFSSSSVRAGQLVKAPVQLFGLEGRYATALYSAASKQKQLETVEKELVTVGTLLKDPQLSSIVTNPHVKRAAKQKTVSGALQRAGVSKLTTNFVNLLAENGRLSKTRGVLDAFGQLMSAHRGEVSCTITTAQVHTPPTYGLHHHYGTGPPRDPTGLDAATLAELKTVLTGFLKQGEVLKLQTKTDPSLMGGMLVNIADKFVDLSVKAKVQKLARLLRETA
ncbi:ATP synthase peripheral stalk subunit OSCP, mitochondrial [Petromyzon marinus]|uniref:ATP synthase peripheral stalk subunit OSCP, mitochondrial n=1 Tax=Petromyzon marinus TaxID=7757 RepID=UPI003F70C8B4